MSCYLKYHEMTEDLILKNEELLIDFDIVKKIVTQVTFVLLNVYSR